MSPDFAAITTQYATDVTEGKEVACKWIKLACKRHLNDLARAEKGWVHEFNPELTDLRGRKYFPAQRICQFAELLPHTKGEWAARGELIKLIPWEIFFLVSIFGWINKETGKRRYRYIDLFTSRKNAKSTIGAIIALYMFAADGEFGAEVYSGATSKDQAHKVFTPARWMAMASKDFRSTYGVIPNISNLAITDTNSKFEPLIGKPGDGDSPSCAIVDEYHEHPTSEQYDTMKTGMGARTQPILLMITTAGSNIGGPCYQHQVSLQKILEGVVENDERFGLIYTMDSGDDWTSDEAIKKANPSVGVSIGMGFLRSAMREALLDPRKQSLFKSKHLDLWINSASPWINVENLQGCGDESLSLDQFLGEECLVGKDLASKNDIASVILEFIRVIDGKKHYYIFGRHYLPGAAVEKLENTHYQGWVEQGYLIKTPGNMINLKQIEEDTLKDAEKFLIKEIALDEWGSREIAPNLQEAGYTVVNVPMNVKYLSEPMKDIAGLIDDDRLHHDGNPVFVYGMSNVEVAPDRNENIFPRKSNSNKKIDPAVALIVAHSRAMLNTKKEDINDFITNPIIG